MCRVRNPSVAETNTSEQGGPAPRRPDWLRGRDGNVWFTLAVLLVGVVTVTLLLNIANARSAITTPHAATPPHGVVAANAQIFHLPQQNPALMTPAIDQQGRIWVGEMAENKLAMLDPRTGVVQAWTPPDGQYNIMAEVVDKGGVVWFTEEAANYIGRFDPVTHTFKTYPLGKVNGQLAGPEAIALDSQGRIWFTEVTGGALGRLDPATGQIATYKLPSAADGAPAYPYALTITPDGAVWYGDLGGGMVGKVDPSTGQVTAYPVNDAKAQVYSMAVGPDGAVWFTELLTDTIGRIDPQTGKVTSVTAPATLGNPATLYSVVTRADALWFTSTGANALVRYIPGSRQFTFYQLATPGSVPFGLAVAPDGALWFTADGAPNYIGRVTP